MLIIDDVFQIKNFMPLFLKGEKKMSWVLVTQKMKSVILQKEDHCVRDCGLFKEWLQKENDSRILIQEIEQ
jgi:hypothetical protein